MEEGEGKRVKRSLTKHIFFRLSQRGGGHGDVICRPKKKNQKAFYTSIIQFTFNVLIYFYIRSYYFNLLYLFIYFQKLYLIIINDHNHIVDYTWHFKTNSPFLYICVYTL